MSVDGGGRCTGLAPRLSALHRSSVKGHEDRPTGGHEKCLLMAASGQFRGRLRAVCHGRGQLRIVIDEELRKAL